MTSFRTIVRELRARPNPERTLELLQVLATRAVSARELYALHESLLFNQAYPGSRAIWAYCRDELRQFPGKIASLSKKSRAMLMQTGIAGTKIRYPYDLTSTRWLMARLGEKIEIGWEEFGKRETDPIAELLPPLAGISEGDALDDPNLGTREYIEAARGGYHASSLEWLLAGLDRVWASPAREFWYNRMELGLVLELTEDGPSRTLSDDGEPDRLFLWNAEEAGASFDLLKEIRRPITIGPPVSKGRGRELLNLAFATLLPRLRELYPLAYANPSEVYDIPLARGVRVILWFMIADFRLPLEAGWGMLVLKNHVPIGYGAGGMLQDRSEIAINVFDTFRGGEAGWLYSQYARILNSLCHAPWLVTRKYQLGYENEEGITSGSYWFYDKLGFRSVDAEIRALAEVERKKIRRQKGYRSPRSVLKRLSQADAVLSLKGEAADRYEEFPLAKVGLLASGIIADQFDGCRDGLDERVLRVLRSRLGISTAGWSADERKRFAQMGQFLLAIPEFERWPDRERQAAIDLCRLKGSKCEADYARAQRKASRFYQRLAASAAR